MKLHCSTINQLFINLIVLVECAIYWKNREHFNTEKRMKENAYSDGNKAIKNTKQEYIEWTGEL